MASMTPEGARVKRSSPEFAQTAAPAHRSGSPLGFQFVAMPSEILRRPDLSPAAKLIVAVVLDSARGSRSGACKLSNAGLAAHVGLSTASVKRALGELEAAGLIRRDMTAAGRVRVGIAPTCLVAQNVPTVQPFVDQDCARGGSDQTHRVDQGRATIQSLEQTQEKTGPILSNLGGGEDPKLSPSEIAAGLRAMIAGEYAPAMFDAPAEPVPTPAAAPSPQARPSEPKPPSAALRPPLDPRRMFGRIGYSARAAIVQTNAPRKSATQQLAELAASRRRREAALAAVSGT